MKARKLDSLQTRLYKRTSFAGIDECWEWTGSKLRGGYGGINYKYHLIQAHRASWIVHFGDIPDKMLVCHSCDNPSCVNPNHLFLGTARDNALDKVKKHRCNCSGENNGRSKLTLELANNIRILWNTKKFTKIKLGEIFGVSDTVIGMIIRNQLWINTNEKNLLVE